MNLLTQRLTYLYAFLGVVLTIALTFYLQFWKGMSPCPLCILQRVSMASMGLMFFFGMAFALKKYGQFIVSLLAFVFSLCGALLAGRQIWIQHLPPNQSADCGVSLHYMMQVLPWDQVVKKILTGTAECSLIDWSFLSLSMAEWSFIWFIFFAVFTLWQIFRKAT